MMKFFEELRKDWMILLFIGTVIVSWTMFSARLSTAEDKIQALETVQGQIQQIQIDVAVVKEKTTNLEVNDKLIRDKLDAILIQTR